MPNAVATIVHELQAVGEDFEWYPTTDAMIQVVARHIPTNTSSIMDIGAGDGRVLVELAKRCEYPPELYAIEKSMVLVQEQPEEVIPIGTNFHEQNLAWLPCDYIFCNPPYAEYEAWAAKVIESGHALKAFLILPQRWTASQTIKTAIEKRGATARVLHSTDFHNADRAARAVVDIIEVQYKRLETKWGTDHDKPQDPFDVWFDQNIDTFDSEEEIEDDVCGDDLARAHRGSTIADMVAAHDAEYQRLTDNYQAVFKLDTAILRELGISKENVRDGIKKKIAGLKSKYWTLMFSRLGSITQRLTAKTKTLFLDRLTGRVAVAFTASNAYAVVLWAVKHANKYYNNQLVDLFYELSSAENVKNYKSNQKTWKQDRWRYMEEKMTHFALDYRIVVRRWGGIYSSSDGFGKYEWPGNLHKNEHELISDIAAVLGNLGHAHHSSPSLDRQWVSGQWQDFENGDGVLFQAKAHKNGNVHLRFRPEVIKHLNIEAGRLLGWIRSASEATDELGYTEQEVTRYFDTSLQIAASSVRLLTAT